ncbi:MAG: hypothetical protein LBT40_05850 [Deltaproteobacteria bacterium]|nr:hypothetical protein [Deltaproteobacteria bacterium]
MDDDGNGDVTVISQIAAPYYSRVSSNAREVSWDISGEAVAGIRACEAALGDEPLRWRRFSGTGQGDGRG